MKLIRDNKFKKGVLAVAISAALTGCNWFDDDDDSSSSSSSSSSQSTTFNVSLGNAPQTLASASFDWTNPLVSMMSQAYADTTGLDETNFKVVIVDADGNAVEVFELTADQVEESPAGSGNYVIEAPGVPQLNCVIAVNVDGELIVEAGDSLASSNALFAPTTATDIDVDLESTVAYQQFLETVQTNGGFDAYDVDDPGQVAAVEQLISNVEQQLEALNLEDYLSDANIDLADLLSGEEVVDEEGNTVNFETVLNDAVDEIINEQIDDIQNATTTTIASLVQNGGLNWFWAEADTEFSQDNSPYNKDFDELEVERGAISSTGEVFYEYDFDADDWTEGESFDPTSDDADDDLVLTAEGWVNSSDSIEVVSVNTTEGTVLLQDSAVNSLQLEVSTLQALDLEGKNIEDFLETNADEEDLATFIGSDAVFGAGATGVKISVAAVNDNYTLWYDEGEDDGSCWGNANELAADRGGNCETVWVNNSEGPATALTQLVTDTPSTSDTIFNSTVAVWVDDVLVELVETTEVNEETQATTTVRTAQFFIYGDGNTTLFVPEDGSTPEWSYASPTGLGADESLIVLPIPEELMDEMDSDDDEAVRIFAVHDGFVRPGVFVEAGAVEDEGGEWVFNATAANNIVDAFDSIYQDVFLVDCFYESGWDDNAFEGLGAPVEPNTLKAFEASVNDEECGGVVSGVDADVLTANTWYDDGDEVTFNADGTGSFFEPAETETDTDQTFEFTWSINSTADDGIPNGTIEIVIDTTINEQDLIFTERYAPVGYDAEAGLLSFKAFSTNSIWYFEGSDIPDGTGEIWSGTLSTSQTTSDAGTVTEVPLTAQ
ncbi:hypothetical protein [Litoribrevibacter albus]|uniref:Uncharacterized protein n=1 Tax=Litoribrevibacter albus TaxID=1473156 RepID=A0AA37SC99_9GAMM|nr:hypothetical protein [Litoribrevibacter albus]GLQ32671.1 hypothetical protein GCM10007876_31500 [Litoribrevibacter albus]